MAELATVVEYEDRDQTSSTHGGSTGQQTIDSHNNQLLAGKALHPDWLLTNKRGSKWHHRGWNVAEA